MGKIPINVTTNQISNIAIGATGRAVNHFMGKIHINVTTNQISDIASGATGAPLTLLVAFWKFKNKIYR